jgi:uncharacterized protein (TIGR02284 family)
MTDRLVLKSLRYLYRIADAGEKGYATAASNMANPALKILFKLYARQRLSFKEEILAELRRLGEDTHPRASLPGAVHRGRVAIFAAMSEKEYEDRVILKEVALGDRVAEQAYRTALSRPLPEPARQVIERQYNEIRKAAEKMRCLRDDAQRRSATRLAGSEPESQQAVQALVRSGRDPEEIEWMEIHDQDLYTGTGATQLETILAGIVGGMIWGGVMGVAAGFGVVTLGTVIANSVFLTWLLTALAFMLMGAFISAVLAFWISVSVRGADAYRYAQIRENAHFLVQAKTCEQ